VDVQLVIRAVMHQNKQVVRADTNGDGRLTAEDVQFVVNAALAV
jgi:hypothetical protein